MAKAMTRIVIDLSIVTTCIAARTKQALMQFGAYVRTRAKTSMRKARQKTFAEMRPEEIVVYEERARYAALQGLSAPKRPLASSAPGEPPRVILGFLKQFLYFNYDEKTQAVSIGPGAIGGASSAPHALEYGGSVTLPNGKTVVIAARPYMRPAFGEEMKRLPTIWEQAIG